MKKNKIKISILTGIAITISGFIGIAEAATANLYVSPMTLTKNTGDNFNVSVGVKTVGNKICVVEGTVAFNNLSCQSITVADDIMAQSSPTCTKPSFSIGIPSCTTSDKILFTVNTKAGTAGTAVISFTGVDIIGEGNSLSTASTNGNYTIKSTIVAPVTAPTTNSATTKKSVTPPSVKTSPKPEIEPAKEEPTVTAPVEQEIADTQDVPVSQLAACRRNSPRTK